MMQLEKYKLGEIAFITKLAGFEHTKYIQGNCVHEKKDDNYIPLFIGKTIKDGKINPEFDWYISKDIADKLERSQLKKKCIVLPYVGTLGDLAIFDGSYYALLGSNVAKIELEDNDLFTEEFIYYYLKSSAGQAVLLKDQQGGVQKNITMDSIRNVEIPFFDKEHQLYITSVLSSLDRKIALNRAINRNLESLAKQLYDYWFVQFDFPDENGRPYKSSGGKMVWNEALKREVPIAWKSGAFSDIANITMGQSPDGSSYNEKGEGIVFYQGSTDFGIRFPSVRMYTTSPSRYAKQGDILMSVRAPVGAVNIANSDCCIGRGLSAINSKKGSVTYIYYVIHYLKVRFDSLNTAGTTFGSITKDELFSLPVVIPSEKILERFEAICKPIFNKQMEIGFELESLTRQRDELLPLLMNGQVEVEARNG